MSMSDLLIAIEIRGVVNGVTMLVEKPSNHFWHSDKKEYVATTTTELCDLLSDLVNTDKGVERAMHIRTVGSEEGERRNER